MTRQNGIIAGVSFIAHIVSITKTQVPASEFS